MSLIPIFFDLMERDPWEDRFQNFGLGMYPEDMHQMRAPRMCRLVPGGYRRHFPISLDPQEAKDQLMTTGKDGFQVCMDVQQFKPSEITVKTVDDTVVVEAKHEDRPDDHGYVSRHFIRKYTLPKGYDPKAVVSALSSDGVLTVKAPTPSTEAESSQRIVQIQQTGPAHLNVKENPKGNVTNGES